jgi:hypothetical protein
MAPTNFALAAALSQPWRERKFSLKTFLNPCPTKLLSGGRANKLRYELAARGKGLVTLDGCSVDQFLLVEDKTRNRCNLCLLVLKKRSDILGIKSRPSNLIMQSFCSLQKLLDRQNWDISTTTQFIDSLAVRNAFQGPIQEGFIMGIKASSVQLSISADLTVPSSKLERMVYASYFPYVWPSLGAGSARVDLVIFFLLVGRGVDVSVDAPSRPSRQLE